MATDPAKTISSLFRTSANPMIASNRVKPSPQSKSHPLISGSSVTDRLSQQAFNVYKLINLSWQAAIFLESLARKTAEYRGLIWSMC
jgi:hypothetical protein